MREQALRGVALVAAAAFPLEAAGVGRDRKAHAAFHGLDFKMGEQRGQVGIIQFVVDDEADIDRKRRSTWSMVTEVSPRGSVAGEGWPPMFEETPGQHSAT